MDFEKELERLLNKYNMEAGSDTPDFLLAEYLRSCLTVFNVVMVKRAKWYGEGGTQ